MADLPHMTDEEWLEAVRDAHAVRAEFYWRIFNELREACGEEQALDLIGKACRKMGLAKQPRYAPILPDDSAATFCDVFAKHSPVGCKLFEIAKGPVEGEVATACLNRCALMDGWSRLEMPAEDKAKLCRAAREVDHGTLEGLGLKGEFVELLSEGGSCCRLEVQKADE